MEQTKTCHYCGTALPEGATECPTCGQRFDAVEESGGGSQDAVNEVVAQQDSNKQPPVAPRFDPNTGQPLQQRFDPYTGQPLDGQPFQQRFDPHTGQPINGQPFQQRFDPHTGQPLDGQSPVGVPPVNVPPTPDIEQYPEKRSNKLPWLIAAIVAAVVVLGVGFYFVHDYKQKEAAQEAYLAEMRATKLAAEKAKQAAEAAKAAEEKAKQEAQAAAEKAAKAAEEAEIRAFIRDMNNNKRYDNESWLYSHCSQKVLSKLRGWYNYEGEGLAWWAFQGFGVGDTDPNGRITELRTLGDGWYSYDATVFGDPFTNKIKVRKKNGKFIIEDFDPGVISID